MLSTSLVLGIRRYRSRLVILGLAAALLHVQALHARAPAPGDAPRPQETPHDRHVTAAAITDDAAAEPMSLLLLGTGLAVVANRLRRRFSKQP